MTTRRRNAAQTEIDMIIADAVSALPPPLPPPTHDGNGVGARDSNGVGARDSNGVGARDVGTGVTSQYALPPKEVRG